MKNYIHIQSYQWYYVLIMLCSTTCNVLPVATIYHIRNAMDELQQDKSGIQHLLKAWHKKKNIKCPSCKASLFRIDGTPCFSSARVKYEIVLIHHSPCPLSIGNCGKGLFFCLSCGGQSSHTLGRLQDRGCKCVEVNADKSKRTMRVDNENEATKKTREDRAQYEHKTQNKTIEHRSSSEETMARESVASIHEYVGGFDDVIPFDSASDQHCDSQLTIARDPDVNATEIKTVSEKRDSGVGAGCFCFDYVNPIDILGNQNEWPSASLDFLFAITRIRGME